MKIIFFIEDGNFWNICFSDLNECKNVVLLEKNMRFEIDSPILREICKIHNSDKINGKVQLPLRQIWKKVDKLDKMADGGEKCFVFTDTSIRNVTVRTLESIKRKENKIAVFFLNPLSSLNDVSYALKLVKGNMIDYVYTIDQDDANKYGYKYCNCCYSKVELKKEKESIDVLYVGQNKGRLKTILTFARALENYNCKFYITGVRKKDQNPMKNVIYNKKLRYEEILKLVSKSKCILECVQDGQSGFTFRFYEAICYDKKLITNNPFVKQTDYYKDGFMLLTDHNCSDIYKFIENEKKTQYNYLNEFSPIHFIEELENDLKG